MTVLITSIRASRSKTPITQGFSRMQKRRGLRKTIPKASPLRRT